MRVFSSLLTALAAATTAAAICPAITSRDQQSGFVTRNGKEFSLNGQQFEYTATNAYWMLHLTNDTDIENTFAEMAASKVKVVRIWAFNDVEEVPQVGPYFQLLKNGQATINTGPNGLQRLDKLVQLADKHNLKILLSLTNNWNPVPDPNKKDGFPRGYLSNSYGGMDAYVRQFAGPNDQFHDKFYTDDRIIQAFKNYLSVVVLRYANCKAVFGWELANDPRCKSTLPAKNCNTQTITRWVHQFSEFVHSLDKNHLVSAGDGGFYCVNCPKLFTPKHKRLTAKDVIDARDAFEKRQAEQALTEMRRRGEFGSGLRVRDNWVEPAARANDPGANFDGSFGVDTEDILNVPGIDFSAFQFFPDHQPYGNYNPNLSRLDNFIQQGIEWIQQHAWTADAAGKPSTISAYGIVSKEAQHLFVPFDNTCVQPLPGPGPAPTDVEVNQAFVKLAVAGIQKNMDGFSIYQWGQRGLTAVPGSPFISETAKKRQDGPTNGLSPQDGHASYSPANRDAYAAIYAAQGGT